MQKILKIIGVFFIFIILAFSVFLISIQDKYTVPIIMYHHVAHADPIRADTVSPANFENHMAFLKKYDFDVLSLDDLASAILHNRKLSRRSVVITLDDGYDDNYANAFEILKKYEFPATIFMPSDRIGKKGHLNLSQLKEMQRFGVSVGSHTRNHVYLPEKSNDEIIDEINQSKRILEKRLGVKVEYFSYPIGGFSESIKKIVQEAGYKGAVATNRGYDRLNKDIFELNRIRFGDRDIRDSILWVKLSGFYNLFRKAKHPY